MTKPLLYIGTDHAGYALKQSLIKHLKSQGGDIDCIDIQQMKQARDAPWDRNEHIATYIDRVEQEVKKLKHGKVKSDENDLLRQMLSFVGKGSGNG